MKLLFEGTDEVTMSPEMAKIDNEVTRRMGSEKKPFMMKVIEEEDFEEIIIIIIIIKVEAGEEVEEVEIITKTQEEDNIEVQAKATLGLLDTIIETFEIETIGTIGTIETIEIIEIIEITEITEIEIKGVATINMLIVIMKEEIITITKVNSLLVEKDSIMSIQTMEGIISSKIKEKLQKLFVTKKNNSQSKNKSHKRLLRK